MKADRGQAAVLQDHLQTLVEAIPFDAHHMICGAGTALGKAQQIHDVIRGTDGPGGVGGLGGLVHPLIILVADLGLADGDGAVLKIHTVPGEASDLRGAKAEPEGQQDRDLHLCSPDGAHEDGDLLRFQKFLLYDLLLG